MEFALNRPCASVTWLLCLLACLMLATAHAAGNLSRAEGIAVLDTTPAWTTSTTPAAASAPAASSGNARSDPPRAAPSGRPRGVLLTITGAIGPASAEYLVRELARAAAAGMGFVVIRIDTPGGLVSSMREINQAILASPIPVIMYVAPSGAQAASAGTYLMYASHLAAMAPGTNLGAATPVQMGGAPTPLPGDGADDATDEDGAADKTRTRESQRQSADAMTSKAINDSVAYIRSLADIHGRNADWAERAVRHAESLPAQEALKQNVVELIAHDLDHLLQQAHGRTVRLGSSTATLDTRDAELVPVEPDWRARFLAIITNPNLAYILLLLGIYGIIFELMNPGAMFPGVLGATSLLVALLALNMLPISFVGVGLLLLGVGLMVAEAFVTSFGLLGLGGVVAFALGSIFLFDGSIPGFEISPTLIVVTAVISLALLVFVLAAVVRAHRGKVVSGNATLIGQLARVRSWAGNSGVVQIHGELWDARAETDRSLQPDDVVRILRREGLTLHVGPAQAQPAQTDRRD